MKRSYFLVPANFLAAIGGGIIISAGINEGRIQAFFIGALIGFSLSKFLPKRWVNPVAPWFSLSVAAVSLVLAGLFKAYAAGKLLTGMAEILFISLLSVRFGLAFFSRGLRSQVVGGESHGIALIELGYYTGMGFGLFVGAAADMFSALLVDAALQTLTGVIDLSFFGKRRSLEGPKDYPAGDPEDDEAVEKIPFDYQLYRRMVLAVACLTVGFQAVSFSISEWELMDGKAHILVCFYVGVALSALMCRVFKISLLWESFDRKLAGNAIISFGSTRPKLKVNFGAITLVAAISMAAALLGIGLWNRPTSMVLTFVTISALVYQVLVITLLDQIARIEKLANLESMILHTYMMVAVVTIISIGMLSRFPNSQYKCMVLTLLCSAIAFSAVRKGETTLA